MADTQKPRLRSNARTKRSQSPTTPVMPVAPTAIRPAPAIPAAPALPTVQGAPNPQPFGFHPQYQLGFPSNPLTPQNSTGPTGLEQLVQQSAKKAKDQWEAYDKASSPSYHQPTFGTKDLAWAIPALLGALSGRNGQAFANGLVSSAVQRRFQGNDEYNRDQTSSWQWHQQMLLRQAQQADQEHQRYANQFDSEQSQSHLQPHSMPEFETTQEPH